MYDELVNELRDGDAFEICGAYDILGRAADAIEELSDKLAIAEEDKIKLFCQIPRWIPVTERLPEEKECVLVLGGYFSKVMETAILDDGLFYSAWDNRTEMFGVTHWMPLPEPPEEE